MPTPPPFPFIVGVPRSGGETLRSMLVAHPDLAIPGESYFPVQLWSYRDRYAKDHGFDLGLLARDLLENRFFPHFRKNWGLDPALVRERISGVEPMSYPEAIRRLYALYAEVEGKPRYGDKTPWFVRHLELLASLFPEATFIHMVRDGRNVALSLLRRTWGPSRLTDAARLWARMVREGREAGRSLGPDRYLQVRYEDLAADPERILREICGFIQLPYRETIVPDDVGMSPLDWRVEMRPAQVAAFEAIAGDELSELGYERAVPHPPLRARVRARGGLLLTRAEARRKATARLLKRGFYGARRAARRVRARAARALREAGGRP